MRRLWLLLRMLACGTSPLLAQQPTFTDSLLDRFAGTWVLRGTIGGEATTQASILARFGFTAARLFLLTWCFGWSTAHTSK